MSYCEIRQFQKGEIIVCEGEIDNYVNLVLKGLVMKYLMLNNHSTILQLATEQQLVTSEISFLTQADSPVYIKALEPTILLSMHYQKMQLMFAEFPKGEELGRKVMEHLYIQKDLRKNRIKQMTVRERFLHYINRNPHMLQRVPQKILASYLQIKPETFSRLKHLVR